ncbi:MAG: hypothetical protein WDO19_10525 [Bacteroidota bacterium]
MGRFLIIFFITGILVNTLDAQKPVSVPSYPGTTGYISFVHPLVTIDKDEVVYNFSGSYTIGFPCGINILKSDRSGFSFEVTPFIKASGGMSKMSNVLFHPGVMFRYPHGFTFIARLAFETAGRYGVTAVFNKVLIKTKMNNYFTAVSLPVRFGDSKPASIGAALQLGISF